MLIFSLVAWRRVTTLEKWARNCWGVGGREIKGGEEKLLMKKI